MRTVGSYEAKTHLPRLLDDVAKGETITITKNGKPVAMLVPASAHASGPELRRAIRDWVRFRDQHNIRLPEGMTIRDMIEEGRKY